MPKVIDYVDRFNDIRRTVYEVTLRDGADAITLEVVAADLGLSLTTMRRLLPSAAHLPELGLQWIERRNRGHFLRSTPGAVPADDTCATTINPLLAALPSDDDLARDAQVWRALTIHFGAQSWARAAMNSRQLHLAVLVDRVVPEHLEPAEREYESLRLTTLVLGAIEAVCTGAMGPDACVPVVRRHLQDLAPAWLANGTSGAA